MAKGPGNAYAPSVPLPAPGGGAQSPHQLCEGSLWRTGPRAAVDWQCPAWTCAEGLGVAADVLRVCPPHVVRWSKGCVPCCLLRPCAAGRLQQRHAGRPVLDFLFWWSPPPLGECASGCPWSTARATAPSPGRPTPGVVKQDKSSRGSVDTTKTRSGPRRVRMSSGERPIGAATGTQPNTEALCQPPPPPRPK